MQYYIFKEACATKETGPVYPQIQKWKPGYNDDKPNSLYSYYLEAKWGKFPDFIPDMDGLILHGKAKPTDLLSFATSVSGLTVSKKLKTLFEQFTFPPYRIFPTKIIHKKKELEEYYFMHIVSDYTNFVDYPNSTFITAGFFDSDPKPFTLTSKQDFVSKSDELQNNFNRTKEYRAIKAKQISFTPEFNKSLDLFEIGRFDTNFYVSGNLRNALLENGITGCEIQPTIRILQNL